MRHLIVGCGDVGRRIAKELILNNVDPQTIVAFVLTLDSLQKAQALGIKAHLLDLDGNVSEVAEFNNAYVYYTVPPQKSGHKDLRSRCLIRELKQRGVTPQKIALISTTGVYGDHNGEWVDETSALNPSTDRAKRRFDSEHVWSDFATLRDVSLVVLRVPGIYSNSRLPRERIAKRTPVLKLSDCGFSNRVHADDLAAICVCALALCRSINVFNASDGSPGSITEYLQAVAAYLGEPPLPELDLTSARNTLSAEMLSYLSESRKISNTKLRSQLRYIFKYPDFREGIKH